MTPRRRLLFGLALAATFALARGPLHAVTHALPVSNDDAIPLLIARHILKGELATILWNQPYNGTLDAYLLAPALLVASPHAVFRSYEAACGLLLVALIGLSARRLGGETAGWSAGFLAAMGTPYMALMAATGPTPNFLVPLLVAIPLLLGLRRLDGTPLPGGVVAGAGLVSGLAVWDSALALPALVGVGGGLLLAGLRARLAGLALFASGFAAGVSPLIVARLVGASGSSPVTALRPRWLWADGVTALARAAQGLFGLQVPLVVDGPERATLPRLAVLALGLGLTALLVAGCRGRRSWPLLGWAVGLAVAFGVSRRTGPDEIRYLFGLVLPVLALAGTGFAWLWARHRPAALLAAAVVVPWCLGHGIVVRTWRDPMHAARVWQVPPLDPVLSTLDRAGVRSAYASLQFAARLSLESDERVIASQAWNERIPGDPLRFKDEVDLDPRAAWVLSPHLSRGMPRVAGFRDLLKEMGGAWKEDAPGDFVVFRRFVPPYDEMRPVAEESIWVGTLEGTPVSAAVLDRNAATEWRAPLGIARGTGLAVRVAEPRRMSAIVLGVELSRSPLAVPWVCTVDGEVVARGPVRYGLQWVGGLPRAGKQALLVVPIGDRRASEARIIFQDAGPPLAAWEVFVYGPDEPARPAAGEAAAEQALERARAGDWSVAAGLYAEAARYEPHRASYQANLVRARWRAAQRRWLDVESLDDGGETLVVH
jgi:hypothetical protein